MKKLLALILSLTLTISLSACGGKSEADIIPDDKYMNTYEIFVYSFCDSDGDGIGDLDGVTSKLDYIKNLGFNAIWLTPICPSTTYHKYDVTDYENVDKNFGSLESYDNLIKEAHNKGIKVIDDFVMNHTSSEHPWFKTAVRYLKGLSKDEEPDESKCKYINYYNFSREKKDGYEQVPGADWYYEARFWSGMPDLNLDNEEVKKEFADIAKFWIDHGCDGFRMDALTSYTTDDTNKSVEELADFVKSAKEIKPDLYIVGEAWTNKDTYAKYYASGIDSLFDFDFAGQDGLIAGLARGTKPAKTFAETMQKEEELYKSYSDTFVNAPFYTNHDMSRGAGYYTDEDKTKLALGLNFMQTGNAFLYYGEELGMKGSGSKDENKRGPMYWSADENAVGMCKGPSAMDKIEQKYPAEDEQEKDDTSIYSYVKKVLKLRNNYPLIARGKTTALSDISSKTIAAFTRTKDGSNYDFSTVKNADKLSDLLIVINTGNAEETIDLSKSGVSMNKVADTVTTSGSAISTVGGGNTLIVPPYSITVLK
ncbi:MAG: alpha-amylase family glycosyl hydrolase [Catonella sp.]|nr:alpha-amylase family glycosyl hydrolase [Catonella sp.]MDY6357304.1 alpha-amylase family glycosyl hydrolase [Catonella sp.]